MVIVANHHLAENYIFLLAAIPTANRRTRSKPSYVHRFSGDVGVAGCANPDTDASEEIAALPSWPSLPTLIPQSVVA